MSKNSKLTIEYVPLERLQPYDKNPRIISSEGLRKLENSISKFGFVNPVLAQKGTGMIIAGHQRLKAAKEQGLKELPVIWLNMTKEEAKAYNLADNRLQDESDWEYDLLTDIFKELDEKDFDLSLTGFDDDEIGGLIGVSADEVLEDEVPTVPEEPKSKLGQVYALGAHRLMCGDSTSKDDVAVLMGDGKQADMIWTDPPWNVNYGADDNDGHYRARTIKNDNMTSDQFYQFLMGSFANVSAHMKPGAMTYVAMSAQEWGNMMAVMAENNYHWSSTIIWAKDTLVLSRKDYHTQYEPLWYGWLEGAPRIKPLKDRKQSDLWCIDRPKRSDEHPTMKPVSLVAKCIENSSNPGNLIIDPFGGSGTTLIAAEQLFRTCYMMELDPRYVDVIINRWENLTGCKAKLLEG